MASPRILVLGDSCIDVYVYGQCVRLNPEAPAPLLTMQRTEQKHGMALNVRDNIKALGCEADSIVPKQKSIKTRYIDTRTGTQLLRLDQDQPVEPLLIENIDALDEYDAIVISDYNKGFISNELLTAINNQVKKPVFVDTKKNSLATYENIFFKLNKLEAKSLLTPPRRLIITLGSEGAWYENVTYPTESSSVVDVCGAGDMFLAALACAVANKKSIPEAIQYANLAASIAVQHQGVYVLTANDVKKLNRSVKRKIR